MKRLIILLVVSIFPFLSHAQTEQASQTKCNYRTAEMLSSIDQARQAPAYQLEKSCDQYLKENLALAGESLMPNRWTNGVELKWESGFFGSKSVTYKGTRDWTYSGKILKDTPEEFLFEGSNSQYGINVVFNVKRKDGKIVYAKYEYRSQRNGLFEYWE